MAAAYGDRHAVPGPRGQSRPAIDRRAADYQSAGPRRRIQLGLGLIWLLDAALQYQPYMFSRAFATQVIAPAGAGSPGFVARPVTFAAQLMGHHPVPLNALFATIQLALGLGLLWRRTARLALAGSIVWALSIWWLGEGLGGIFAGSASPVTGAPGAAVLYALIAVLAWPPRAERPGRPSRPGSVAAGSIVGWPGARLAWAALWGSGAYYLLLAPNRAPGALRAVVAAAAAGEPSRIAALQRGAATAIGSHSSAASVILAVVFGLIAVGVFVPVATRPVLVLAVVTAAAIGVLGQALGQIMTGHGTDPNTGPLLILLAAAYWPVAERSRRPARRRALAPSGRHRRNQPAALSRQELSRQEVSRRRAGVASVAWELSRLPSPPLPSPPLRSPPPTW
ncbi:MAG TPA: hypothetical protein VIJ82_05995 [Streptosporangiaceae bacterium]